METKKRVLVFQRELKCLFVLILLLSASIKGLSQFNPPDPDSAPAVPFDDHLHIVIIVAGALLGIFILRRNFFKQSEKAMK